jgi:hypothetical protein
MGLKNFFKKLVPSVGEEKQPEPEEGEDEEESKEERHSDNECALCNAPGAEKKWMGQYWHKQCLRSAKKMAKKMV